jgi:ATP-dependent protease ClpP protease subunit
MTDFFKNLNDNDFFSNKLTHIYFNGKVEDKTVDKLINDVINANKKIDEKGVIIEPKPILIHINSKGGSVYDGMRFFSIFKISSVPIATIIDNYSYSAATFLSVHSPYRIMTKNSFCLLHYYSASVKYLKRHEIISEIKEYETYFNNVISMYLKKTKFNKEELDELLQHDLFLDYKFCLEKGIVDRIIEFNVITPNFDKNINEIIKDEKTINLRLLPCSNDYNNLDLIIRKNNENKSNNIYIIYPIHNYCNDETSTKGYLKPLNNITEHEIEYDIFHTLNLINRINVINGTKIAIIDVPISIDNILPLLFTNKIYIYNHSFIICNLLYLKYPIRNILIADIVKNYKTIFNRIKTILKQKTKMNMTDINNINNKYLIITPKEAIKLGLCNEIIYS